MAIKTSIKSSSDLDSQKQKKSKNPKVTKSKRSNESSKLNFKKLVYIFLVFVLLGTTLYFSGAVSWAYQRTQSIFTPKPEPQPEEIKVCIDSNLRPDVTSKIMNWVEDKNETQDSSEPRGNKRSKSDKQPDKVYDTLQFQELPDDCAAVVSTQNLDQYDLAWREYYVIVTKSKSEVRNLSTDQFNQLLGGTPLKINNQEYSLVISAEAENFLNRNYGLGVGVAAVENPIQYANGNSRTFVVIPFEDLSYKTQLVSLDDKSIFNADESITALTDEIWIEEGELEGLYSLVLDNSGEPNYKPEKLTSVILTGTSVLGGRGMYIKTQELGDELYPLRNTSEYLQTADITHISNESIFAQNCTQRDGTLIFCGTDGAYEGLKFADIDVVGLTGNHILDYGDQAFVETLNRYDDDGIKYFGGGRDLSRGRKPAVFEINGMKFAFLGYNFIPPASYFADNNNPGSVQYVSESAKADIAKAKQENDFVIVDMQWGPEYTRYPNYYQIEYGKEAVDAGADIVNGVHPHWVQPVEYYNNGLIFYSLGNFLFDQTWAQEVREGVMVKHFFYEGEYLGFEPTATMIYESAQPKIVEGEDKKRIENYLYLDL